MSVSGRQCGTRVGERVALVLVLVLAATVLEVTAKPSTRKSSGAAGSSKGRDAYGSGLVKTSVTRGALVKALEASTPQQTTKRAHYDALAYVTPWNNYGYDAVKIYGNKFTLVAPVWFDLKQIQDDGSVAVVGQHNVDGGWMQAVRDASSGKAKLVPRFLFDGWVGDDFLKLLRSDENMDALATSVSKHCDRYGLDGVTLDTGVPRTSLFYRNFLRFVMRLRQKLVHGKRIVMVIPPQRGPEPLFAHGEFKLYTPFVDHLSLMTYDYSGSGSPGPNAPADWVRASALQVLRPAAGNDKEEEQLLVDTDAHKLLIGLNFYGMMYSASGSGRAILGRDFAEGLKGSRSKLQWDAQTQEHVARTKDNQVMFYPTPMSVHARVALANELGCGIAVWEVGQGLDVLFDTL